MKEEARKRGMAETPDLLYNLFIQTSRENMHVILCFSPLEPNFRNRLRMYPGLVNCTTIDWFSDWPEDALLEVGDYAL
jgi:dynein heavy chain